MDPERPAYDVCPNCGTPAETNDRFCRKCGLARYPDGANRPAPDRPVAATGGRRFFAFLALAVAAGVLIAGAAFYVIQSGILSPKHTINGTFTLYGGDTFDQIKIVGSACTGTGGYS